MTHNIFPNIGKNKTGKPKKWTFLVFYNILKHLHYHVMNCYLQRKEVENEHAAHLMTSSDHPTFTSTYIFIIVT